MAKKQTRRSISVSRVTYERLKSFCEANNISMSQFVEARVGESLGDISDGATTIIPVQPRPTMPAPRPLAPVPAGPPKSETRSAGSINGADLVRPLTSAAARMVVEPPPPVIKPKQEQPAPKPAEKRPDQIFTF